MPGLRKEGVTRSERSGAREFLIQFLCLRSRVPFIGSGDGGHIHAAVRYAPPLSSLELQLARLSVLHARP